MEEHGTDGKKSGGLTVSGEEAGLKVIGLLERHFGLPKSLLHRWIRTGQVRVNGGRVQPFARVEEGDTVRVPPFAEAMAGEAGEPKAAVPELPERPGSGEKAGPRARLPAGLTAHAARNGTCGFRVGAPQGHVRGFRFSHHSGAQARPGHVGCPALRPDFPGPHAGPGTLPQS